MKTFLFAALLAMFSFSFSYAQKPIGFTDDEMKFGNTMCPGVWVDIPEVNAETIKSAWKKTLEKGSKSKALIAGNEITIFGAILKEITTNPVNIFSAIQEKDSVVKLFASVELSRDEFAGVNRPEYDRIKSLLKEFAKENYSKVAKDQLSDEEKKLKDLEKELSSLRREKEKLEKEIQSANTTISEETYKITTTEKEIVEANASYETRAPEVNSMVEGKEKKAAQSELKSLEKKIKDLQKSNVNSESKISKSHTVIKENTAAIELNLVKQDDLGLTINQQKMVVNKYTSKLNIIQSY